MIHMLLSRTVIGYEKRIIAVPYHYNLGHSLTSVNNLHGELPNINKLPGNLEMVFHLN